MKYRLTESAQQDIREIVHHIRNIQKSPQNARLVAARLKEQFRRLVDMPLSGHSRAELDDKNARVISVSGVLVIYDPSLRPLTILRVVHASRDLERIDIGR
jgi:toxin ParE1/3/4